MRLHAIAQELSRLAQEIEELEEIRAAPLTLDVRPERSREERKAARYLTTSQAAEYVGLAKQTLSRWLESRRTIQEHPVGSEVLLQIQIIPLAPEPAVSETHEA